MKLSQELEKTLDRVKCGDVTVTDQLTATKMVCILFFIGLKGLSIFQESLNFPIFQAIRNAISEAFKTPEIVALFAKKDRAALRQKMMLVCFLSLSCFLLFASLLLTSAQIWLSSSFQRF